ncbi:sensor histidine kinase [Sediminispirochaeta smaragdinae]|uniref:histidine kinase n=1 Tax=Sediminispirochaeta smaragdinae (strain DSM 11293 / JCM 15392 / SEBR 4228) TaxID=573413 RepID=E1RB04_SEDSS|nr:histidine kinase [Sediminispirochaeta smaragdinae]ADK79534.1 integral membrane sensor signal transduction histidine kinase [Sediminispirochaeta smaragdinae DSM 11293]
MTEHQMIHRRIAIKVHSLPYASTIALFLFCNSLLLHFASTLYYGSIQSHSASLWVAFRWQFLLLMAVSFCASISQIFFYLQKSSRLLFSELIQFVSLVLIGLPMGQDLTIEMILSCALITMIIMTNSQVAWIKVPFILLAFSLFQFKLRFLGYTVEAAKGRILTISEIVLLLVSLIMFFIKDIISNNIELRQKNRQLEETAGLLTNANRSIQEYTLSMEEVSAEKERLRMTRELHDIIGYTMVNTTIMMEEAIARYKQKDESALLTLIVKTRDHAKNAHQDVRKILLNYRSQQKRKSSFIRDLIKLTETFSLATGISIEVFPSNFPSVLPYHVSYALLRISQEGLTNSLYHGRAKNIVFLLTKSIDSLFLIIRDNGQGSIHYEEGLGISGMRERLRMLKGTLTIKAKKDLFELHIEIPYKEGQSDVGSY